MAQAQAQPRPRLDSRTVLYSLLVFLYYGSCLLVHNGLLAVERNAWYHGTTRGISISRFWFFPFLCTMFTASADQESQGELSL